MVLLLFVFQKTMADDFDIEAMLEAPFRKVGGELGNSSSNSAIDWGVFCIHLLLAYCITLLLFLY